MGLDAGAGGIRLVGLGRTRGGQLVLERCGLEPLGRDWIRAGNIEKFDQVVDAARHLLRRTGIRGGDVAMALPSSEVVSKRVILPAGLSQRELAFRVEAEASRYLSFPPEEVSLDFCLLGPSADSPGDVEVQIAAAHRDKVEDRQGLAEALGLTPVIVDVDSRAARRALARLLVPPPGELLALVELGATSIHLQVLRDGQSLHEREHAFDGDRLIQLPMQQHGFGAEEAQARLAACELPAAGDSGVQRAHADLLAPDIERALRLFFTSTPHHRVDRIVLAGAVSGLDGLAAAVARHSATPCAVANPFGGMRMGRHVHPQQAARQAPACLTACGLALRRFQR